MYDKQSIEVLSTGLQSRSHALFACALSFLLAAAGCSSTPKTQSGGSVQNSLESRQQACERGDLVVCTEMGVAYIKGEGVAKDEKQGLTYLRKACQGNIAKACFHLGAKQLMGGTAKDVIEGVASLKQACDGKNGEACFLLGTISAGLLRIEGFEPNQELAKSYYKKGCEYGHQQSCSAAE